MQLYFIIYSVLDDRYYIEREDESILLLWNSWQIYLSLHFHIFNQKHLFTLTLNLGIYYLFSG